jgi:hypothetical protein
MHFMVIFGLCHSNYMDAHLSYFSLTFNLVAVIAQSV